MSGSGVTPAAPLPTSGEEDAPTPSFSPRGLVTTSANFPIKYTRRPRAMKTEGCGRGRPVSAGRRRCPQQAARLGPQPRSCRPGLQSKGRTHLAFPPGASQPVGYACRAPASPGRGLRLRFCVMIEARTRPPRMCRRARTVTRLVPSVPPGRKEGSFVSPRYLPLYVVKDPLNNCKSR